MIKIVVPKSLMKTQNPEGRRDELGKMRSELMQIIRLISEEKEIYVKKLIGIKRELKLNLPPMEKLVKRKIEKAINLALELGAQKNYLKNIQRLKQFLAIIRSLHRFPIPSIREEFKKKPLTSEEQEKIRKRVEERTKEEEIRNKIKELGELTKQIIRGKDSIEKLLNNCAEIELSLLGFITQHNTAIDLLKKVEGELLSIMP